MRNPSLATLTAALVWIIAARAPASAAESSSQLYRSVDEGSNWKRVGEGLPEDIRINAFTATGDVVVACLDSGIFVSEDEGSSWRRSRTGLEREPRALSAATDGAMVLVGTQDNGVLISHDRGASWRPANSGLTDQYIRSLLVDGDSIYAGTNRGGVFVSRDHGASWTPIRDGLPESCQVFDLAVHRGTVFAALYNNGLHRWDGDAETWSRAGDVVPLEITATRESLIAGHNPGGVFVSGDGGKTWSSGNAGLPHRTPVWTLAASGQRALVGTTGTIGAEVICLFASTDGGVSWRRSDSGLPPSAAPVSFLTTDAYILVGVVCPD